MSQDPPVKPVRSPCLNFCIAVNLDPQVLSASVHDVRYFATLLRGVNFANVRAWAPTAAFHDSTIGYSERRW